MRVVVDENIRSIVSTIDLIGRTVGAETVFRDWCECAALAFANGCDVLHGARWEAREKRYLSLIGKYDKPALSLFAEMLARLTNAFEADPFHDHLGHVYMECFGGNKNLGQCFTPAGVCECCASLVGVPEPGKPSTLYEPACGGGAMIIAYLKKCHEAGYAYQRLLKIQAADLDSLCVHMCYVQLSLLGARAVVSQQDSISLKTYDVFVTPGEALWPAFCYADAVFEPQGDDIAAKIEEFPWLS